MLLLLLLRERKLDEWLANQHRGWATSEQSLILKLETQFLLLSL